MDRSRPGAQAPPETRRSSQQVSSVKSQIQPAPARARRGSAGRASPRPPRRRRPAQHRAPSRRAAAGPRAGQPRARPAPASSATPCESPDHRRRLEIGDFADRAPGGVERRPRRAVRAAAAQPPASHPRASRPRQASASSTPSAARDALRRAPHQRRAPSLPRHSATDHIRPVGLRRRQRRVPRAARSAPSARSRRARQAPQEAPSVPAPRPPRPTRRVCGRSSRTTAQAGPRPPTPPQHPPAAAASRPADRTSFTTTVRRRWTPTKAAEVAQRLVGPAQSTNRATARARRRLVAHGLGEVDRPGHAPRCGASEPMFIGPLQLLVAKPHSSPSARPTGTRRAPAPSAGPCRRRWPATSRPSPRRTESPRDDPAVMSPSLTPAPKPRLDIKRHRGACWEARKGSARTPHQRPSR